MKTAILLFMIVFATTLNNGFIYIDSLVVVLPSGVSLNFDKFYELVDSYGYNPRNYIVEDSSMKLIVYKPWYDPYYIVVLGLVRDSSEEKVFIEIIRIGRGNVSSIVTSSRDHYTILYRELSYLIDYGVLENISSDLRSYTIYGGSVDKILDLPSNFEETIISMNIVDRPPWETRLLFSIGAGVPGSIYTGTGRARPTTTIPYPTLTTIGNVSIPEAASSENTSLESTTPIEQGSRRELGGESVLRSSYESMDKYYFLLISFLVASIFSLIIYYVLKKHY